MNLLYSAWAYISKQGIEKYQTFEDQRAIRIMNQSGLVAGLVLLLSTAKLYGLGIPAKAIVFLLSFALVYLSLPLINRYLGKSWARATLFGVSGIFVFWESSTFGYESHTHYGFLLVILAAVLNLFKQYCILFWSTIGFCLFLIALLYATNFSLFSLPEISLNTKVQFGHIEFAALLLTIGLLAAIYATNQQALINKLKSTQDQLKTKNQALTKVNKELDQFVYSVSHDLRAPIASVLGLIDLSMNEENVAMLKEYLQLKKKSLHKLDNFISELIDFSRNSRLGIQHNEIDWESLVETILEEQSHSEQAMKITKTVSVEQSTSFISDQKRLRIILQNLISNSIRYSNLNQEHPSLKVVVSANNQDAEIKVYDNGIGIQKEHLPRIFEMFFRAQENNVGSGLGLYIVKEAVEKIGGQIKVLSRFGEETIFTVTIPNLQNEVVNTPQNNDTSPAMTDATPQGADLFHREL
ncbi:MAG: HAMP domain-containing sensor histidine kinase [Bacteroidota bacterium]